MSKVSRGKLLVTGVKGPLDTPQRKRLKVVAAVVGQVQFLLFVGLALATGPSRLIDLLLLSGLPVVWFFVVVNPLGIEVDAVYEQGVSNRKASLLDTLTGRAFQRFDEIRNVGLITPDGTNPEGFILLVGDGERWRVGPFWQEYANEFYESLKDMLHKACPSARWIPLHWDRHLQKRRMTLREAVS